jgi:glutathione synthase/RimK-type ligase-like ATP-grasp enzyme
MKQQPVSYIGTTELVSLPDYGIDGILAKVDTGADSSAIWASNIIERDNELSFTLFGPLSPHYSGEKITTKRYSLVTVKNSFGQKETRYKVSLKLRLANRTINTKINLANRTNNRFPILIGRRTLHAKFVVDVAKRNRLLGNRKVMIILNRKNEANMAFTDSMIKSGVEMEAVTYSDLVFKIGSEGNRIVVDSTGNDVSEYGLVYFRTSNLHENPSVSGAIAKYLEARNADFIDQSVVQSPIPNKVYQYVVLTDNNIQVPQTIFMLPQKMKESYENLVAELGLPFVLKDIRGHRGENNFLINSKAYFDRSIRQSEDLGVWLLAQQYIPNDYDFRIIVLGSQAVLAIKRIRTSNQSHLNNVSLGGRAELVDVNKSLPSSLITKSVMAAKLFQLQIAGVDLVQDKVTKLWYCLEVNKAPQIDTGSFVKEKTAAMAKYLHQRLLN